MWTQQPRTARHIPNRVRELLHRLHPDKSMLAIEEIFNSSTTPAYKLASIVVYELGSVQYDIRNERRWSWAQEIQKYKVTLLWAC